MDTFIKAIFVFRALLCAFGYEISTKSANMSQKSESDADMESVEKVAKRSPNKSNRSKTFAHCNKSKKLCFSNRFSLIAFFA